MRNVLRLIRDDRGAGAIEYALIASLISVAAVAAFDHMGEQVETKYENVDKKL